jgi:hypothetical protein
VGGRPFNPQYNTLEQYDWDPSFVTAVRGALLDRGPTVERVESRYPQHDKLRAVQAESQAQGEFVDWLEEQGIFLAEWVKVSSLPSSSERLVPATTPLRDLLAEYHGVDQAELEREKRAMLDAQRRLNDAG